MSTPVAPRLAPLADRLRRLGHHGLALDLSSLGGELAGEGIAPDVLERLVVLVEKGTTRTARLVAAAQAAETLLSVADRTGEIDEAAGVVVLARLRRALEAP